MYIYNDPDPESEVDEFVPEKQHRMERVRLNRKHKRRDRARKWCSRWRFIGDWAGIRRRDVIYTFNRVPAPTALRHGVAYEKRPRKDLFRK